MNEISPICIFCQKTARGAQQDEVMLPMTSSSVNGDGGAWFLTKQALGRHGSSGGTKAAAAMAPHGKGVGQDQSDIEALRSHQGKSSAARVTHCSFPPWEGCYWWRRAGSGPPMTTGGRGALQGSDGGFYLSLVPAPLYMKQALGVFGPHTAFSNHTCCCLVASSI